MCLGLAKKGMYSLLLMPANAYLITNMAAQMKDLECLLNFTSTPKKLPYQLLRNLSCKAYLHT